MSLADGVGEAVSLPGEVYRGQLYYCAASGIEALAEVREHYPSDYQVLNLTTGEAVRVGTIQVKTEREPYEDWVSGYEAWSPDGNRVAYWIGRCHQWATIFRCGVARYALYLADAHSGTRVQAVYTSRVPGPAVFSPDGRRIVYYGRDGASTSSTGGEFYLVNVP